MVFLGRLTTVFTIGVGRALDGFVAHNRRVRALARREARRRRHALARCEARFATSPEGSIDAFVAKSSAEHHRRFLEACERDVRFCDFLLGLPVIRSRRRRMSLVRRVRE